MGLPEQLGQLLGEPGHLLLEGLAVVLLLLDAHIPAGGEDVVLPGDFLRGGHGAEALDILQGAVHKSVVGIGQLADVLVGQLAQFAGHHGAHLAGVDEQGLALLPLVSGQEPQGDGNLRGIEQLGGHGHDAVHQIGVDDVFADVALAAALGGEGTVGQHHADAAVRRKVPDHVLEPGKVGVAGGRRAVLPAHVVQKFVLPPVRKVEGRVRQNEVRLELGVAVIEEGIGVVLAQVGLNAADGQVHLRHLPGGGVGVLAEYGNPVDVAAVVLHELGRLHEHAAAAAAGVYVPTDFDTKEKALLRHRNTGKGHKARASEVDR